MKTQTQNKHTPGPLAYAVAIAGEHAHEFARDQIAKFRPGGANYRRLRDLQDAGEYLQKSPALYAAAPELLAALEFVAGHCDPSDKRHILPEQVASAVRAAIAKAKGAA